MSEIADAFRRPSVLIESTVKVIAEAEAIENNSEIARHYGLACRWSVAGDVTKSPIQRRAEDVCQMKDDGPLHPKIS